jgi:hypothetical protein
VCGVSLCVVVMSNACPIVELLYENNGENGG